MAWKRDLTGYWLATPAPAGVMLTHATDVSHPIQHWLGIAEGVAQMHARGLVHGDIDSDSVWINGDHSTLVDPCIWVANGDEVRERQDDVFALGLLLRTLTHVQSENVRTILTEVENKRIDDVETLIRLVRSVHKVSERIDGTVRVVALETPTNPRYGDGIKFRIIHSNAAQHLEGGFFWSGAHGDVYDSVKGLWEGAEVAWHRAHIVTDSEGRRYLTATADTIPVLEPHWFTSVTDVIKAEGCVSRYFVDLRDNEPPGKPLVLGNMLHGLLEDLMSGDAADFDALWERRSRTLGYTAIAAKLGDPELASMREEAAAQFKNLQAFAAGKDRGDRYNWSGESVEVARYSTLYGIEGRIDLVTEDSRGLNVVELKTGSVREEHNDQVRAYKLLWEPYAAAQNSEVSGYLIYSREGNVRTVDFSDTRRSARLVRSRNHLVAAHHQLAQSTEVDALPYYDQFPEKCRSNDCRFRRRTCEAQCNVLGLGQRATESELAARARRWWRHFHHLIEAEHWSENAAYGDSFRVEELDIRIQRGRCIAGLTITSPAADGVLVFGGQRLPTLSTGSQVIAHQGDPCVGHMLRGYVVRTDTHRVALKVPSLRNSVTLPTDGWFLELVGSRMGYRASQQNLYQVISTNRTELLKTLCALATPTPPAERGEFEGLNPRQSMAVQTALRGDFACLIEGPPGTGKTTVIARVIKELDARKRVLVCAQTNTALDTVLERLLTEGVRFVRVGASHRCEALAATIDHAGLNVSEYFSDDLAAASQSVAALTERLLSASVIACTVYGVSSSDVIRALERLEGPTPFDVVIVDEATQLTEPATVGALVRAKRFVLVGDPKQLPPVTLSTPDESLGDPEMGLGGLEQSLFERLLNLGMPSVQLHEQYRMNDAIMAFSNRAFYGGLLNAAAIAGRSALRLSGETQTAALVAENPVVFIDVDGAEAGRTNTQEAQVIAALVQELLALGVPKEQIGVISPFRSQVELLRQVVHDTVDCDTVERYQGGEREVILLSMVRTESTGAFITDARRLNVAVTRARTKLIVVGHAHCLRVSPMLRELIDQPETTRLSWV